MDRQILNDLRTWKGRKNRKPLIIRGVRQVGKTYLLNAFGEKEFRSAHYFNFEEEGELKEVFARNLDPARIINALQFSRDRPIDPKSDLVIFDEIQECPRALTSLKYFCEKMPALALCAAGSLLGVHLGANSFPVGKVEMIDMYPLSFMEFLHALGEEMACDFLRSWDLKKEIPPTLHTRLWERLKWYFVVGGLPEAVEVFRKNSDNLLVAFQKVRTKQEQLIRAYLADIAKHAGKANAMHIERILRAIPAQAAKTEDGNAQKFRFRGVVPQVDKYSRLANAFDWLNAAGLAIKVQIANSGHLPFSAFTLESRFKLLLFDVGLLGAMSGLPIKAILDYDYGTYKGYFAESFVAQELLCAGEKALYSWQEERAELEFLLARGSDPLPIEVKSGWVTKAKSLGKFQEKYHPPLSVILSAREAEPDGEIFKLPLYLAGFLQRLP